MTVTRRTLFGLLAVAPVAFIGRAEAGESYVIYYRSDLAKEWDLTAGELSDLTRESALGGEVGEWEPL